MIEDDTGTRRSARHAVLLTGHFPEQRRKGSMLWLSEALLARGWHVTIVTVGHSWLSVLRGDKRLRALDALPPRGVRRVAPGLDAVFHIAPVHPVRIGFPLTDRAIGFVAKLFEAFWTPRLRSPLEDADLVVIESGLPVLLSGAARAAAPNARLVYRVNDDLRVLGLPDAVSQAEEDMAPVFDRISTASPVLAAKFTSLKSVAIDPMGVPKATLDRVRRNPYTGAPTSGRNVVCAGTTQIDLDSVLSMARLRPDWTFRVFGPLPRGRDDMPENVILTGERGFEEIIEWVKYADIGLAPYLEKPGVNYQAANSNRMLLYRYFGLPILAPERITSVGIPRGIGYRPGDVPDIDVALFCAERLGRGAGDHTVSDWSHLCDRILCVMDEEEVAA